MRIYTHIYILFIKKAVVNSHKRINRTRQTIIIHESRDNTNGKTYMIDTIVSVKL